MIKTMIKKYIPYIALVIAIIVQFYVAYTNPVNKGQEADAYSVAGEPAAISIQDEGK